MVTTTGHMEGWGLGGGSKLGHSSVCTELFGDERPGDVGWLGAVSSGPWLRHDGTDL